MLLDRLRWFWGKDRVFVDKHPRLYSQDVGPEFNNPVPPTSLHTRAHSPIRHLAYPNNLEVTEGSMERLSAIFHHREADNVKVAVADGSATVPAKVKLIYLAIYFLLNLGLTLYNKAVMIKFPFPFLLTALHAIVSFGGASILKSQNYFTPIQIGAAQVRVFSAFSLLYTSNIAISNLSLSMVTVPFHQTVRATTPIFTVLIYTLFFGFNYTSEIYLSLIPVVGGVALAVYGDYSFSLGGFCWTVLGALLASVKTVATNRLQTSGLHLNALELLHRMSILAVPQALIMAYLHGEPTVFMDYLLNSPGVGPTAVAILLSNAAIAFFLNWASFTANRKVGALTMTVAANVKQVLTVLLSIVFWNLQIGLTNTVGIGLTLIGSVLYGQMSIGYKAAKDVEKGLEK